MKPSPSEPQSAAMWIFDNNLATVTHSVVLSGDRLKTATKRMQSGVTACLVALRQKPNMQKEVDRIAKKLGSANEQFVKEVSALVESNRWRTVTLVTLVEAYLQDILADAAGCDPSFLDRYEHSATYAQVTSSETLEELAGEIRSQWARAWVASKRRPSAWLNALKKMGARGFEKELGTRMDYMWTIRHLVVHRAGRGDRQFAKRYQQVKLDSDGKVPVSTHDFGVFVRNAGDFVNATEKYFLSRLPQLAFISPVHK